MNSRHPEKRPSRIFSGRVFVLLILVVGGLVLFRIYGMETYHANRNSIWWTERGRNLIPPTAVDIQLRQDLLDHYAVYNVSESDLNAFLNQRFSVNGVEIDSYQERSVVSPLLVGKEIGPMGWMITEDVVVYSYSASNGGGHDYYHDPTTGQTYQESAYW